MGNTLKEKQIEEMANDIFENCNTGLFYTEVERIARFVIEKGYRKSTEVAEEIFAEIEKYLVTGSTLYGQPIRSIAVGTFARLKKKYIGKDKMREPKECEDTE